MEKVIEYESNFPKGSIIDGLMGEEYFNSRYKIAWFLKEAYSTQKEGFHYKEHLAQPNAYENFYKEINKTWHPIIYASYGILNNFSYWEELYFIRERPEMCDIIKNILIINVNKYPSSTGTYTNYSNLALAFKEFKSLIKTQVETLQPQVYIFGNTFSIYKEFFNLTDIEKDEKSKKFDNCDIYIRDGNLYLDVYHPSNLSLKRETYVDQIIESVEYWSRENKSSDHFR